jgi:hypothetical protein
VQVSLRGTDFTNVASIQGTIKFNPAIVTFSSVSAYGLPGMGSSDFNITQAATGKIIFSWADGTLNGINMSDGAALFTLTFNLSGTAGSSTQLQYASVPTLWEVTDSLFNTLDADTIAGRISIAPLASGIENSSITGTTALLQNSPNPFTTSTTIKFTMAEEGLATLTIYNILGDKVFERCDHFGKGINVLEWNGTDQRGQHLCNGTYFYRLQTSGYVCTKRMIVTD